MDFDTLISRLEAAVEAEADNLPDQVYLLDVTDGESWVLEGSSAQLYKGTHDDVSCTISASKKNIVRVFTRPLDASMLLMQKKIKISDVPKLLQLQPLYGHLKEK